MIPFDTHAEIERLRSSGATEELAEAITQTVRNGVTGGVATKADIAEVKGDIARSQVTIIISIAVILGVSLSIYAFLSGAVGQAPAP